MRALSIRQPWAHAIIHGGKRIENRAAWANSSFRGRFLVHAAKGMSGGEYDDAVIFAGLRGLPWARTVPDPSALERGGIVGVASVIGVIHPDDLTAAGPVVRLASGVRATSRDEERWWMGGFALVLDDVRPLPFVPCKGALGFFKVPDDVMQRLAP